MVKVNNTMVFLCIFPPLLNKWYMFQVITKANKNY